jgi:hypothetical protein
MSHTVTLNLTVSPRQFITAVLLLTLLLSSSAAAAPGTQPPGPRERPAGRPDLGTRYWSANGASLHPYASTHAYTVEGDTCIRSNTGDLWLARGLELPHGAHISRVEMAGTDSDPSFDMTLWFRVANLNGTLVGGGTVQSSGSGGSGVWGTDVDVTVDNYNYVYGFVWTNNAVTTHVLCGIVVTYQVPVTSALMPAQFYNLAQP